MSEEEKKIIDRISRSYDDNTQYVEASAKDWNCIVALINKNQKEIEDLKAITQNYNAIGGETFGDDRIIVCSMKYFDDGYFKKNYIFKDKIRDILNYLNDTELNNYEIVMAFKKMMKELLEDGDHIPRID